MREMAPNKQRCGSRVMKSHRRSSKYIFASTSRDAQTHCNGDNHAGLVVLVYNETPVDPSLGDPSIRGGTNGKGAFERGGKIRAV